MAVGYAGYAQIMDGATPVTLLTTGTNIAPQLNPIISNSAVGYGWQNAADASHYANGVIDYRGNINFDMQGGTVWDLLKKWALTERVYAKALLHSPDGTRLYKYGLESGASLSSEDNKYGAWCDSFGLNTSTDSTLTAAIGILALSREEDTAMGKGYFENETGLIAGSSSTFNLTAPLNPTSEINTSPIPFWKTNARILTDADAEIDASAETVTWNVDLANNAQIVKTCNGLSTAANYGVASAVVMGPMAVSGSVELYKHSGVWDPVLNTHPIIAYNTKFKVSIISGVTTYVLTLPAIRLESDAYDMNLTAPVTRTFSIKGMGGKSGGVSISAPMTMS